jgi:hypothetical protein
MISNHLFATCPLPPGSQVLTSSLDICKTLDTLDGSEPLGGSKVDRAVVDQLVDSLQAWNGNDFAAAHTPDGVKGLIASLGAYKRK